MFGRGHHFDMAPMSCSWEPVNRIWGQGLGTGGQVFRVGCQVVDIEAKRAWCRGVNGFARLVPPTSTESPFDQHIEVTSLQMP